MDLTIAIGNQCVAHRSNDMQWRMCGGADLQRCFSSSVLVGVAIDIGQGFNIYNNTILTLTLWRSDE